MFQHVIAIHNLATIKKEWRVPQFKHVSYHETSWIHLIHAILLLRILLKVSIWVGYFFIYLFVISCIGSLLFLSWNFLPWTLLSSSNVWIGLNLIFTLTFRACFERRGIKVIIKNALRIMLGNYFRHYRTNDYSAQL